ncbi:MAG TPA: MBL fold metallo-hydrolase [Polyangiales bacterium]|nr:MBL fold metallo-hydrolase [Polyangiales bacterium]
MRRHSSIQTRRLFCFAAISGCVLATSLVSPSHAVDLSTVARPGVLPNQWIKGGPDCSKIPSFQVHPYNSDFYILRESGCVHSEKPFLYLLFGSERAILFDTGAGGEEGATREPDTTGVVHRAMNYWAAKAKRPVPPLVVSHLHSHDDHTWGDPQFADAPDTTFVPPNDVPALQAAFGIANWPDNIGSIDLGGRVLDVIPIPGHDDTSIAVYDRETAVLLTGDTLYPGRIYINSTADVFAASIARLVAFTKDKVVAHVLGTHIEQTTPYTDYPVGTIYQPLEAPLSMSRGSLLEMLEATTYREADGTISQRAYKDFSVCGTYPNCAAVNLQ